MRVVRQYQPPVFALGVAGGFENGAAVKHGQVQIHPRAQALEHGGKMPRIDAVAVNGGVPVGLPQAVRGRAVWVPAE